LLTPSTRPTPAVAVTVATGFLVAEAVLAILLKQVDPRAPIGVVYAALMGVALVVNFVAGVAAAGAASAERRLDAELAAELARLMLRAANLHSAAEAAARHLAVALSLRFASVDLEDAAGDHRGWAIPLRDADVTLGVLEVPDDLPRATRERLLRLVPTFEALLAAARERQNINDRLIETRQRLGQFFELSSDLMVISDEGNLLQVNPAFERTLGYTVDDLAPTAFDLFDLVPREDMDRLGEPIRELTDGRGPVRFENRATGRDGSPRWIEWNVAAHQGLFYAVGRDITRQRTEQERLLQTQTMLEASRDELRALARQQTALRRVAELVAREAEPAEVFAAVAEEMAGCLDAYNATVARFEGDEIVIAALGRAQQDLPHKPTVGERFPLDGDHIAPTVLRTGRPARIDSHEHARGATAERIRRIGVQCMVGVPIVVGAQVWGVVAVASRTGPLPADTEARMADFADLVGTSIANAATRADLQASRDSLRELADSLGVLARQQAALRRVATLVARGVSESEVFSAVAEEMAGCLDVANAEVFRYEDDGAAFVVVASYAAPFVPHLSVGERLTTEGDNLSARVFRTGKAARMDSWESAAGSTAERARELGIRSCVGAPIVVEERVWGMAIVGTTQDDPLPPDTEARIAEFAELVATAIAAATARADLIASRARIVVAADDARRRLERDIHDGAQQRLVSLGLKLRLADESVPPERDDLKSALSEAVSGLTDVFKELQEISRGIHPAILSTGGLAAAFKTLARRSTVPVNLDLAIERRLPDPVEVAAYYVVAEALTNAAKHAQASEVKVRAHSTDEVLYLFISDNGIGGADSRKGSGLIGLEDRIEVLGGRMYMASPPGGGTAIDITIPHNTNGR
jgi:PAS domain S-box-containing protein